MPIRSQFAVWPTWYLLASRPDYKRLQTRFQDRYYVMTLDQYIGAFDYRLYASEQPIWTVHLGLLIHYERIAGIHTDHVDRLRDLPAQLLLAQL